MPSSSLVALSSPNVTFMGWTFSSFDGVLVRRMDASIPQLSTMAVCAAGITFMVALSQFVPRQPWTLPKACFVSSPMLPLDTPSAPNTFGWVTGTTATMCSAASPPSQCEVNTGAARGRNSGP